MSLEAINSFSDLNMQVLDAASRLSQLGLKLGEKITPDSTVSRATLEMLPVEKKTEILKSIQENTEWLMASVQVPENLPEKDIDSNDVSFAKATLAHRGLFAHDDFWKTIAAGDVIEIYSLDMVQIFRSLSFFKFSRYSLLDLSVFEWYVLYERPKVILEKMHEAVGKVIQQNAGFMHPGIPKHILKEVHDTGLTIGFEPSVNAVEFCGLGCIWDQKTKQLSGIITSSRVEAVAKGKDSNTIAFLN